MNVTTPLMVLLRAALMLTDDGEVVLLQSEA
jgi:hypothetical protein